MGGKVSVSLSEIEANFDSWLLENVPSTYHSVMGRNYNQYEQGFDIKSVYDGQIDKQFANTMTNLIVKYLQDHHDPASDKIVRLSITVINELLNNNLAESATKMVKSLSQFDPIINSKSYQDEITRNKNCTDEVAYIVTKPHPDKLQYLKHRWNDKYWDNPNLGLTCIETIDELILYDTTSVKIFNDKYFKQFKMLFCYEKNPPFEYIMSLTLNDEIRKHSKQCLMWLLETFEYTYPQMKQIFMKAKGYEPAINNYIITKGELDSQFFLDLFWMDKSWRQEIVKCGYLSENTIKEHADTADKRNIVALEFGLAPIST
jgi:hypothetical protein